MTAERPIRIDASVFARRIYAPNAYRFVRDTAIVPIVHSEAEACAAVFPIAWRRDADGPSLVVLRGLIADQRAQPPRGRALLPLRLTAYPFIPAPSGETDAMFDDVFADEPQDAGAAVVTPEGKPTLATRQRLAALGVFRQELPPTRAIGEALADQGLLEPWDLSFDVLGQKIEVPGLHIANRAAFDSGRYAALLGSFGLDAARLLACHRLSLFKAGVLLTMARALLEEQAATQAQPEIVA